MICYCWCVVKTKQGFILCDSTTFKRVWRNEINPRLPECLLFYRKRFNIQTYSCKFYSVIIFIAALCCLFYTFYKFPFEIDRCSCCVSQAEARLAAKRAARAEARDIRMRELERQQKEVSGPDRQRYSDRNSVHQVLWFTAVSVSTNVL